MIAYALTARVIQVYGLKEGGGYRINISLGGREGNSKGFANIIWSWGDTKHSYAPQVGDLIMIPKFDFGMNSGTNPTTQVTTQSLSIFTSYLEKITDYKKDVNKAKEVLQKVKQVNTAPEVHKNADSQLDNINWDDDTLADSVVKDPIVDVVDNKKEQLEEILKNDDSEDVLELRKKQEDFKGEK